MTCVYQTCSSHAYSGGGLSLHEVFILVVNIINQQINMYTYAHICMHSCGAEELASSPCSFNCKVGSLGVTHDFLTVHQIMHRASPASATAAQHLDAASS